MGATGDTGNPPPTGAVIDRPAYRVGVVSDTHGHLYAEVRTALQGVDYIIHAGDIGSFQVLAELRTIAPVTAVRGNCDYDSWALALPERAELTLAGARLVVGHVGWQVQQWAEMVHKAAVAVATQADVAAPARSAAAAASTSPVTADAAPAASASAVPIDVVIFGHSHQSYLERRLGMLYLNPGSAGPRRFNRPRSLARLAIVQGAPGGVAGRPLIEAEIIELD